MGVFKQPGSASGQVFNAATSNWALGLNHDEHSWTNLDRITLNVIAQLGPPRPSPWGSVSEGQTQPGGIVTAIHSGVDQFALFLADPQGGVYTASGSTASGSGWSSVSEGQTTPGAPVTAVSLDGQTIFVFLADPSGEVYVNSGSGGDGWQEWIRIGSAVTAPGGHVTALVNPPGELSLFLVAVDGQVYTSSSGGNGSWRP